MGIGPFDPKNDRLGRIFHSQVLLRRELFHGIHIQMQEYLRRPVKIPGIVSVEGVIIAGGNPLFSPVRHMFDHAVIGKDHTWPCHISGDCLIRDVLAAMDGLPEMTGLHAYSHSPPGEGILGAVRSHNQADTRTSPFCRLFQEEIVVGQQRGRIIVIGLYSARLFPPEIGRKYRTRRHLAGNEHPITQGYKGGHCDACPDRAFQPHVFAGQSTEEHEGKRENEK